MNHRQFIGIALGMTLAFGVHADDTGPAFSCDSKVLSHVEGMICSDTQLATLDRRVTGLFASGVAQNSDPSLFRRQQRAWLRQRDACRSNECIEQSYRKRVSDLERYTGEFEHQYLQRLCHRFEDSAARDQLLAETSALDDINNDGIPERIESCSGGTANVPCAQYYNGDKELLIEQSGYEWKDYWTFGQRLFRYDGKTFFLHASDGAMIKPSYVSYVTPTNIEFVVCEFSNRVVNVLEDGDPKLCEALQESPPVALSKVSHPPRAFERAETVIEGTGEIDIDNDGQSEHVAELVYSNGRGSGCAYTYFELTTQDGSLRRDATSALLNDLQMLEEGGFSARNCGAIENRLIQRDGRVYLDSNSTNNPVFPHQIRVIEHGIVRDVCTFSFKVETMSTATR